MVVILETVDQATGEVRDPNGHFLIFIYAIHYQAELIGGWVREYMGKNAAPADGSVHFIAGSTCDPDLAICLLYTSPSPRDLSTSRMPSSA